MPAQSSLVGNALLFTSLVATVGIGLLAAVGLVIAMLRRRIHPRPPERNGLPRGWRVIAGGRRPDHDHPARHPRANDQR